MDVIRGINAYINFSRGEEFPKFACAENVAFEGENEMKSVKTVGDGPYRRFRRQSLTYTVSVDGLIPIDEPNYITAWDLLEYWKQGIPLSFQIVFERDDNSQITMIRGDVFVVKPSITGPMDFAGGSFTLQGSGEPLFGLPPVCLSEITSYTLTRQGLTFIYSVKIFAVTTGSVPRYDWRLDNGPINTSLDTGWPVNVATQSSFIYGSHKLEIWPVCDNGAYGTKLIRNFTVPI